MKCLKLFPYSGAERCKIYYFVYERALLRFKYRQSIKTNIVDREQIPFQIQNLQFS